jgi:hypothetical protein
VCTAGTSCSPSKKITAVVCCRSFSSAGRRRPGALPRQPPSRALQTAGRPIERAPKAPSRRARTATRWRLVLSLLELVVSSGQENPHPTIVAELSKDVLVPSAAKWRRGPNSSPIHSLIRTGREWRKRRERQGPGRPPPAHKVQMEQSTSVVSRLHHHKCIQHPIP